MIFLYVFTPFIIFYTMSILGTLLGFKNTKGIQIFSNALLILSNVWWIILTVFVLMMDCGLGIYLTGLISLIIQGGKTLIYLPFIYLNDLNHKDKRESVKEISYFKYLKYNLWLDILLTIITIITTLITMGEYPR